MSDLQTITPEYAARCNQVRHRSLKNQGKNSKLKHEYSSLFFEDNIFLHTSCSFYVSSLLRNWSLIFIMMNTVGRKPLGEIEDNLMVFVVGYKTI